MIELYQTVEPGTSLSAAKPRKLLDQLRDVLRAMHYAYSTEQAYVHWVRRFILFHNKRHPRDMGAVEIEQFLTHRREGICGGKYADASALCIAVSLQTSAEG